jgi:hypothetical protein
VAGSGGSDGNLSEAGGGNGAAGAPLKSYCSAPTIAQGSDPTIDDFEDLDGLINETDGRKGGWYAYDDGTGVRTSPPPDGALAPGALDGRPGAGLKVAGSGFTSWGIGVGTTLGGECYDAKVWGGIAFYAKGNVPFYLSVKISATTSESEGGGCDSTMTCGDHFTKQFFPGPDWEKLGLSWEELEQSGYGTPVSFNPRNLKALNFTTNVSDEFELWIDDIEFSDGSITAKGTGKKANGTGGSSGEGGAGGQGGQGGAGG